MSTEYRWVPSGSVPTVALLLTLLSSLIGGNGSKTRISARLPSLLVTPALRQVVFEPHLRGFYPECGFRHTEAGLLRLTKLCEGR